MSTPKLRDDEIALLAVPRARNVTTTRNMPNRRYHYVVGALMVWRRTGDGDARQVVRMAVHTECRQWITLPVLVDDAPFNEICDLCALHDHRDFKARMASGQVDF